jgi:hypothetical protein
MSAPPDIRLVEACYWRSPTNSIKQTEEMIGVEINPTFLELWGNAGSNQFYLPISKEKKTKYTKRCIWHINRAWFSLKLLHIKIFVAKKILKRLASSRRARRSVTAVKILTKTWMCQRIFLSDIAQYKTSCKTNTHVRKFALFLVHMLIEKVCFAWIQKHQWARKIIGSKSLRHVGTLHVYKSA